MAEPQTDYLQPGQMFGEFRVVRRLGKGGMGMVFLVEHPQAGRYAVKIVDPAKAAKDREYVRRFAREGRFARKHRHPNLIPVHDIGQDPDTGFYYLIMDYMPGGDVGQRLKNEGRLSIEESVRTVAQVAGALDAAHAIGMVHRDIKPENIMFDADGTPKLADLGVAKFSDVGQTMLTSADVMIGTPAYMAPEQIMDSHGVDAQADVYSLGIVLFEMLTGRRPNEGLSVVEIVARAVRGESIPDVRIYRPDVPDSVAHLLNGMCEPRRERRLTTPQVVALAGRVLAQMRGEAAPAETAAQQPSAPQPSAPRVRLRRKKRTPTPVAQRAIHHLPRLRAETPDSAPPPAFRFSALLPLLATRGGLVAAAVAVLLFLVGALAGSALNRARVKVRADQVLRDATFRESELTKIRNRSLEDSPVVSEARARLGARLDEREVAQRDVDLAGNLVRDAQSELAAAEKRVQQVAADGRAGRFDAFPDPVLRERARSLAEKREELKGEISRLKQEMGGPAREVRR